MNPSVALLAGVPKCKPWKHEMYGTNVLNEVCGCGLGTMLVGYAGAYGAAVEQVWPYLQKNGLQNLDQIPGLKGAALNNVKKILVLWKGVYVCPVAGCNQPHWGASMVSHLNDDHDWTREAQAGWLSSVGM